MISMNNRMAELLKKRGILTAPEIDELLSHAISSKQWLGQFVLNMKLLSDEELANFLAKELNLPLTDPLQLKPDYSALQMIPIGVCRQSDVLPVGFMGDMLRLAVVNPLDEEMKSSLSSISSLPLFLEVAPQQNLQQQMDIWYKELDLKKADNDEISYSEKQSEEPATDTPLHEILLAVIEANASDLHLSNGLRPVIRVHGELKYLPFEKLNVEKIERLIYSVLTPEQQRKFQTKQEIDLSYTKPGIYRFRVNMFVEKRSPCAIFRVIPSEIPSLESLGMPPVLRELTKKPRGLVLVTGPTGSGKTTTLAAMVNEINTSQRRHIVTLEDPIEFVHEHINSEINQRQIGEDCESFAIGLRQILRQDPDVILVGEMRDLDTIATAITAANTGHLVLGTLHTTSAEQTINRIIDMFPSEQQNQIRSQLAMVLEGIIAQTLIPNLQGNGRCCAQEILVVNSAVSNLIREDKIFQIASLMQIGGQTGMQTLDQALKQLVDSNQIHEDQAKIYRSDR